MSNAQSIDPARRQVLVKLGNRRFVVFGPAAGLPEPLRFAPEDLPDLPRVADESEGTHARIIDTLQVSGMIRRSPDREDRQIADVELLDSFGNRTLVEVKVREREPRSRDVELGTEQLDRARSRGENLEVWFVNIERLNLTVMRRV